MSERTCIVCARVCPPKKNSGPKPKADYCGAACRAWARCNPGKTRPPQEDRRCLHCGVPIGNLGGRARFCGVLCGNLHRGTCKTDGSAATTCERCGCIFEGRSGRVVCAECKGKQRRRTCDDCGRWYSTKKGLICDACSRRKHAPKVPCEWCAAPFPYMPVLGGTRFCSNACRATASAFAGQSTPVPWKRCRCERWFIARPITTPTCGRPECVREHKRQQMRDAYARNPTPFAHRIMGLYGEATRRLDIPKASMWRQHLVAYLRSRDGDACGICAGAMRFDLPSGPRGDDRAPSIDHVVPRSRGGSDDLANLRLAHWGCNRQRGNRGGNEQLRLVG